MEITTYQPQYQDQVIDLILGIQNNEAKINLSLNEQPDLKDIPHSYQQGGGEFWVAVDHQQVVGTIALMNLGQGCGVLKKFFVSQAYRKQHVGSQLYSHLLEFAKHHGFTTLILDTPSVAHASHRFYERVGFHRITKAQLPVEYHYPDRDSLLYLLKLTD